MSIRIAVDIGGTFTDATLIDEETGRVAIAKVLSTPADPSGGFMAAVERALAEGEPLIDEETGRVAIAKVLSTPADPSGRVHGTRSSARSPRARRPRRR